MSAQTTLTEDAPMILDATCSDKKIWPRFASIRMDIRRDVNPDIVASACYLPFRDGVFQEIYCDPPHYISSEGFGFTHRPFKGLGHLKKDFERFGYWKRKEDFVSFLESVNREFARALKYDGQLKFKIACGVDARTLRIQDISILNNFETVKSKSQPAKTFFSKATTYFLTMKPKSDASIPSCPESSEHSAMESTRHNNQTRGQENRTFDTTPP